MPASENDRRSFLGLCTAGLLALIGLLLAVPLVGYVSAPLRRRRGTSGGIPEGATELVDLGLLDDLPLGQWQRVDLEVVAQDGWEKDRQKHAVWVLRQGEASGHITVLSPICPHLGCPINWDPARKQFLCPCHGGTFDAQGRYLAGPPLRSMDHLDFEVRAGRLWVRWEDFQTGVAQREPVAL